uniref:Uncharacterized protein n=1 Tax=Candidozyma auris TaxID=498019 RepID=A0A0L0P5Y8_CANAR
MKGQDAKKNGRVRIRTGDLSHAKRTRYQLRHTPIEEVVPSRIELLILALLAPRLNQLGQGTNLVMNAMHMQYRNASLLYAGLC